GNDEIGAMAGSLKSFRDTLQQTQHELAQAGKLALLGQLSAGIGHELNQPLGAIRHYARNGKLFLDQQRVDEARSNLEKIARLTERARRIIERLRSMARKPGQELSRIDLLGAVDNVLTLLDHRMEKMGVEVELDIDEPNRYVAAGQLRLEQLLLNLLNNGLDAMADTENPRIKISSADDDGHIELLVSDSGHGVAAENIERIFDPFFSTKEVGRGVGIGLSISYNIVKDFGGTIRCESVPEKGAVFRISLERR
ncbi:MAG: ATP-binding protein, partial [Thermodesulfobacteriota bacterium]